MKRGQNAAARFASPVVRITPGWTDGRRTDGCLSPSETVAAAAAIVGRFKLLESESFPPSRVERGRLQTKLLVARNSTPFFLPGRQPMVTFLLAPISPRDSSLLSFLCPRQRKLAIKKENEEKRERGGRGRPLTSQVSQSTSGITQVNATPSPARLNGCLTVAVLLSRG